MYVILIINGENENPYSVWQGNTYETVEIAERDLPEVRELRVEQPDLRYQIACVQPLPDDPDF